MLFREHRRILLPEYNEFYKNLKENGEAVWPYYDGIPDSDIRKVPWYAPITKPIIKVLKKVPKLLWVFLFVIILHLFGIIDAQILLEKIIINYFE